MTNRDIDCYTKSLWQALLPDSAWTAHDRYGMAISPFGERLTGATVSRLPVSIITTVAKSCDCGNSEPRLELRGFVKPLFESDYLWV